MTPHRSDPLEPPAATIDDGDAFRSHEDEVERLQSRLRQTEELYRQLVESAGDILYRADVDGRFTYANPAAVRITGYALQDLIGMHFTDLVRPDYHARMVEMYLEQIASESSHSYFEFPCVTAEGREIWLGQNVQLIWEGDRVVGVQAVAREITEMLRYQLTLQESEEKFRAVAESLGEGLLITDLDEVVTYVNSRACEMLEASQQELVGRRARDLLLPRSGDREGAAWPPEGLVVATSKYSFQYDSRGGEHMWLAVTLVPFRASCGEVIGSLALLQDITAGRAAEEESLRLAALSRENPNPVLECDEAGRTIRSNPAADRLVRSHELGDVRSLLPAEHEELVTGALQHQQGYGNVEVEVAGRILAWTYHPYPRANTVHLFAVDITSRRDMEERLRHDALHDSLTGLPNRVLFMERLNHTVLRTKRRADTLFAVLFLDLDRFKVINDSLGHHAGDEMLVTVAKRLKGCLRPMDTVARLGGDEFAILLEDVHEVADATRVSERIQQELSAPLHLSGFEVFTSASIGIALSTIGHDTPDLLLRNADMAMYRAKAGGHARIEIFDRGMHAEALQRLQLETDLRHAVDRGEFRVHYQPVVCLFDRRIVAVEALVRWHHPERGLLLPETFIAVAEETGLMARIGQWVLREACRQGREWRGRFPAYSKLGIGVNISPKQLAHENLVTEIRSALQESGLEPHALKLEVTEGALMENVEEAALLLTELKGLGVKLFVDDFGTGFSSLSHLHTLPLDSLKIDRSFVGRMETDELTRQLVQTILGLAEGIGVSVVAEGIETEGQLEVLRGLGCRMGQGHHFCKPVEADKLTALLERGGRL